MRSSGIDAPSAAALFLLCLLWALPSLRSDLLPGSIAQANSSPLLAQAINLALFAILAATTASLRKANWPRGSALFGPLIVGVGLFVLPALLVQLARGNLDNSTRVALFSLVPVFAVVFEPHFGSVMQLPQSGGLAAALVAVAGTFLIFPLELPRAAGPAIAFCSLIGAVASVASANCLAVRIAQVQTSASLAVFAAIATGSASGLLAIAGLSHEPRSWSAVHIDAWAIADLCSLALLFWLMRRMSAVRMTTRFLIAPLAANLIGLVFLRHGVQLRAWLGLILIALGSAWLVFAPIKEPEKTGSPLGIS